MKVKFYRMNLDAEFFNDIMNGNGFIISEPAEMTIDGVKKKSLYGAQSPLYGTSYEDEQSFVERYRCECGAFKSRQFEGETCPICGTKIECRDSDINIMGWISLGDNRIISPYYYEKLKSAIGKPFPYIITSITKVDINGQARPVTPEENANYEPKSPYDGIGIDGFYEKYDEILNYFKQKKKNKAKTIDLLLKEKRCVFTSHIPIPSTMLRPQGITNNTFYYTSTDRIVSTMFSLSNTLKQVSSVEKQKILERIQTKASELFDAYIAMLKDKKGHIRGEMLGGRLNYTARNVIVPDPTLALNQIDLSYNTFLKVFEYKIIAYLMKIENITLSKAYEIWCKATEFDERVYKIMNYIIETEDTRCLINRNPTLNFYSMLLMKIRKIEPSADVYSMSVPLEILPGLNADFDGDILNIVGMMDDSLSYMFRKFDPVKRMIISRDTGYVNTLFAPTKGQKIDLHYFCTMGAKENDVPQMYAVQDNDSNEVIYVPESEIKNYKSGKLSIDDYDVWNMTHLVPWS